MTSLSSDHPPVALESTVLSHGLPRSCNLETARSLEKRVLEAGAHPVTIGYRNGILKVGLSDDDLIHFCRSNSIHKVSVRDIPIVKARHLDGATTVSATMRAAFKAGIRVMATGGIGGVHRDIDDPQRPSFDESADLNELARTPLAVVCSGPKSVLHLPATRERLESLGVTVVGYRTDTMPAFYCPPTDLAVDTTAENVSQIAAILNERDAAGLPSSVLIVQPVDPDLAIDQSRIEDIVESAGREARRRNVPPAGRTPFLLETIRAEIGEQAIRANIALLETNATLAANIAVELAQ